MSKAKIIDKKSIESILGEKKILSELSHPFIVNMIYSFQDFDYLYLVMELLSGGNLRYNLRFKEIWVLKVLVRMEYLLNIIHKIFHKNVVISYSHFF